MTSNTLLVCVVATALSSLGSSAHAETFQWKDSNGQTIISDTPPPATAKNRRSIGGQQPSVVSEKPVEKAADGAKTAAAAGEFIRNLCMHAAAMKPSFLSYTELDPEFVEKETIGIKADIEKENEELARLKKPLKRMPLFVSRVQLTDAVLENAKKEMQAELKAQGKPEQIWDKIIPGQIERFIADNTQLDQQYTLLSQFYVMDDKKTIAQVVEEKAKELGGKIELVGYVRFELGEGLEKKACDFASEVAEQLK